MIVVASTLDGVLRQEIVNLSKLGLSELDIPANEVLQVPLLDAASRESGGRATACGAEPLTKTQARE